MKVESPWWRSRRDGMVVRCGSTTRVRPFSPPLSACDCCPTEAKGDGIGRVGIATDQARAIIPVNFTLQDGQALIRVGKGFMSQATGGHLVAFEIDHINSDAEAAWSMVVRGRATMVERATESDLEAAGRPLVPEPEIRR